MGYISPLESRVHESKKGNIMIAYDFINNIAQHDVMYIGIPKGYKITKNGKTVKPKIDESQDEALIIWEQAMHFKDWIEAEVQGGCI